MQDLRSLLETLDDAISAYKRRIAELEVTVQNQQSQLEALKPQSVAKEESNGSQPATATVSS